MAGVKVHGKEHKQREYSNRINMLITQSQAAFAESIGANRDKVNNWIRGRSEPDVESLIRISKEYGVSTDWILGIAPIDQRSPDVSIQGAIKVTGLSEETITKLNHLVTYGDKINFDFLDSFICDASVQKISIAVGQAISCRNIQKIDNEVDCNTAEYPFLYDVLARVGAVFESDDKNYPVLPKGTMILEAEDACEYYKEKSIKIFSSFVNEYVSLMSDAQVASTSDQKTEK